jgi:hypothetical protein
MIKQFILVVAVSGLVIGQAAACGSCGDKKHKKMGLVTIAQCGGCSETGSTPEPTGDDE